MTNSSLAYSYLQKATFGDIDFIPTEAYSEEDAQHAAAAHSVVSFENSVPSAPRW